MSKGNLISNGVSKPWQGSSRTCTPPCSREKEDKNSLDKGGHFSQRYLSLAFKKKKEFPSQPQQQSTNHCLQLVRNFHNPKLLFFSNELFFLLFIYLFWETERKNASGGGAEKERRRERENPKQAPSCQHRTLRGAWTHEPRDHDLSWSQTLKQLSHPGAPPTNFCSKQPSAIFF